ncbi:MAG: thiamine pyrophosphate-dependent enzyme [Rhodospirillaceae bacterium]
MPKSVAKSGAAARHNSALQLKFPTPPARPGEDPDYSKLALSAPGEVRRPAIDTKPEEMRDLAYSLIRVMDDDGKPVGPWNSDIPVEILKKGLRYMVLTRVYDDRMYRAQRQGKTSFYIKCTGEEAISVAAALALDPDDMCFTAYRQQGIYLTREYPLLTMMGQIYSNTLDPLKGRQMPIMYSAREKSIFTISGNLTTQYPQAVGWAMASAMSGDTRIASTWVGDGSTAEGDFHYALTLAAVYHAPVILNIVNNQWAISSFQGIAGGEEAPFAARGIGYGLPALRVDGNDFLAVYAATRWAAERARANLGATVIELFTYRAEGHSTSDDPSRYRSTEEGKRWPLGDPIDRLMKHLIKRGAWSEKEHAAMEEELVTWVKSTQKEAEAAGTLGQGKTVSPKTMFEDVFKEPDWRQRRQRQEAGF